MEKQYSIEIVGRVTKILFYVNPSFDLAIKILDELAEKDIYERRLFDFSRIHFDWSVEKLISVAEHGKNIFLKPNKLAIVAPKDLAFGEMRQFEVYRSEDGHSLPRVFRREEDAIEWLNS